MPKENKLVNLIITNLIRLILFLTFIYSLTSPRPLVQAVSIIALFTTFIPTILEKLFKIKIPSAFEIIYLMFLYGLLTLGELRGFYSGIWWWSLLMTFTASLALGFVGLSVVHVLYKKNKISPNPILASVIIFSIALSLGTLWEIFEFTLDTAINTGLQKNLPDTMYDLLIDLLGALLVSTAGYISIKRGSTMLVSTFISGIIENSSILHGPKRVKEDPIERLKDLIEIGENSKIEFKSTLRTNLHTKQFDKKMETSTLKTITAFLNSSGGNLIIGLDDNKKILGLENDNFPSLDKMSLHLTNLIKNHIGAEFLPFIKYNIITIENKKLFLIICQESKKRVFLKIDDKEEFYVRNGPSSTKLEGNALVDYITNKFQE